MAAPYPVPTQIRIYHFTHLDNLASILQGGALLSNNLHPNRSVNVSYNDIQRRRQHTRIPCGPSGTLHDYVPFYFAPRSPMLFTITQGNVEGFQGDPGELVYLVGRLDTAQAAGLPYVFSDGHPIVFPSGFYADPAELGRVDWPLMKSRVWKNTENDRDRMRRRQAELLVHERFPWELLEQIVVKANPIAARVAALLRAHPERKFITIGVNRNWYY